MKSRLPTTPTQGTEGDAEAQLKWKRDARLTRPGKDTQGLGENKGKGPRGDNQEEVVKLQGESAELHRHQEQGEAQNWTSAWRIFYFHLVGWGRNHGSSLVWSNMVTRSPSSARCELLMES